MSDPNNSVSIASILSTLTSGWELAESSIISAVAAWFGTELLKLTSEAISQIASSLQHFYTAVTSGRSWGDAMASLLTEVWNNVLSDLAQLATDFVEAVGRVLANVGLIPSEA